MPRPHLPPLAALLLAAACGAPDQPRGPAIEDLQRTPLPVARALLAPTPRFTAIEGAFPPFRPPPTPPAAGARRSDATITGGLAVGDFDDDGRLDVFVVDGSGNGRLLRQHAPLRFHDVTAAAGIEHGERAAEAHAATHSDDDDAAAAAAAHGAAFADIDHDGDLDLYVLSGHGRNRLYVHDGDGTFREAAGPHHLDLAVGATMAAFGDYDRDGLLDLFLVTQDAQDPPDGTDPPPDVPFARSGLPRDRLLRAVDRVHVEVSVSAGLRHAGAARAALWCDLGGDGLPELCIAGGRGDRDRVYHNCGGGRFAGLPPTVGEPQEPTSAGASALDAGDVDGDGAVDLVLLHHDPAEDRDEIRVLHATPDGTLRRGESWLGPRGERAHSVLIGDLDHDGRLDVVRIGVVRGGVPAQEQAATAWVEPEPRGASKTPTVHGVRGPWQTGALADLDGDGDLDLLLLGAGPDGRLLLQLHENRTGAARALTVALSGRASDRFGTGARVELRLADDTVLVREAMLAHGRQCGVCADLHFGLGDSAPRTLTVRWPSGALQTFDGVEPGHRLRVHEPRNE